jgi:hypothetical protein
VLDQEVSRDLDGILQAMGIPDRQLLLMTVVVAAAASIVAFVSSGGDWVGVLIALPIFLTFSFYSIRISRWLANRVAPPPESAEAPEPTPQTSQRPEHARRRRRKRRRGKG